MTCLHITHINSDMHAASLALAPSDKRTWNSARKDTRQLQHPTSQHQRKLRRHNREKSKNIVKNNKRKTCNVASMSVVCNSGSIGTLAATPTSRSSARERPNASDSLWQSEELRVLACNFKRITPQHKAHHYLKKKQQQQQQRWQTRAYFQRNELPHIFPKIDVLLPLRNRHRIAFAQHRLQQNASQKILERANHKQYTQT